MHLPLAIIDNVGQLIAVISLIGGLLLALVIPVVALILHHRKRQLWHETARLALEKGQPLPPSQVEADDAELTPPPGVSFAEWQAAKRAESRSHATKGGLVLIAVGGGIIAFFSAMGSKNFGMIGTIPGFIGIALLIHAVCESFFDKSPRPPQS